MVLARILWLLGLARATEDKMQVRVRARRLAEQLSSHANAAGHVAVVGHGYMNIFTRKSLEASGWRCVGAQGHGYWSHSRFVKKRPDSTP